MSDELDHLNRILGTEFEVLSDAIYEATDRLRALQWVPVSEQMPPAECCVLIRCDPSEDDIVPGADYEVAAYYSERDNWYRDYDSMIVPKDVSAWMFIPEE